MKMINVKIKLIDGGKMPRKGTAGAACYDCYAREDVILDNTKPKLIPLGFAMAIPEGYCAKIYPEFEVVEELPETERGTNGYGSTGRA